MRRSAFVWATVIATALLVAHSYGYAFAVGNQTTYFLHALQHAHPELFRHDWLVSSTNEYHSVFGFFAGLLFEIDDSGATVFAITHVVLMVMLLCGMFLLVRGVTMRATLSIFWLVTGWLLVNGEHSIAGSYLWSGYLQPSLIGAVGWMIGLAMHVRGRPLAAGIALAIGGLFHVNFLLLGIGAFGLAELIADGDHRLKRLALLLAPQLVALAILAPEILAHSKSSDPAQALWVLVQFHAPLHYKPSWIARTLPSLVRWLALAVAVAPIACTFGERPAVRRLVWWTVVTATICTAGTLIIMIPGLLPLTRLYIWRLAPFTIVAAQLVIAIAIAAVVADHRSWHAIPIWRRVAAIALCAWIAASTPFMTAADADWILWIAIGAVVISFAVPQRWRTLLFSLAAIGSLAVPLWYRRDVILHPSVQIDSEGPETDGLYEWARTTTPTDAVFLVPPDLMRFRLVARRAIYVDFKSPPLEPDGLIEWHHRLRQITGEGPTDKLPAHRTAWIQATGDELLRRAKELGLDFLVLDRSSVHDRIAIQPIFQNQAYAVFAVPGPR
jgi:hypothetical protein